VFTAVTEEIAALLDADAATMGRFEPDGTIAPVGWTATGAEGAVDARTPPGGHTVTSTVFATGRPARIDHHGDATGAVTGVVGSLGVRSSVGVPIVVAGRVWGVVVVSTTREEALPAGTEERLAGFTELVATAIANAEAQVALTASRARIVATDDAVRRRIERNLHDGAQQQLVSLGLRLRALREDAPAEATDLRARLDKVADGVAELLDELREVARGIHPVVLAEGGLVPAVRALARRSAVRVRLDLHLGRRLPEPVELAAYYVVAEALTNAATHAGATAVGVSGSLDGTQLRLTIHDDGRGGAAPVAGSGLIGLTDRVEALGGRLLLHSPPGEGTTLTVALPLGDPAHPPAGGPGGG
jgi:signal transduction histidine kinase